jgi:hypothetical protein
MIKNPLLSSVSIQEMLYISLETSRYGGGVPTVSYREVPQS